MKLQDQVPSLELCKKLKELGYPQNGLWWWWKVVKDTDEYIISLKENMPPIYKENDKIDNEFQAYVAPTVAEMGEFLKEDILPQYYHGEKQWVWYSEDSNDVCITANTEADIRAKVLIYLTEQGHIQL